MSKGKTKSIAFPNTVTNQGNHVPSPEESGAEDQVPVTEVNDYLNAMKGQTLYDMYINSHLLDSSGDEMKLREGDLSVHVENLWRIAQAHASMLNGTAQRRVSLQERPAPVVNIPRQ